MGKKHYDVADDIKRLLLSDLREQKQQQAERRIVEVVFAGSNIHKKTEQLLHILRIAHRRLECAPEALPAAKQFLRAIAQYIFEKRELSLWLRIFELWDLGLQVSTTSTSPKVVGRTHREVNLFISEFFRYVGADRERSITFALFLLDQIAALTQRIAHEDPQHKFTEDAAVYAKIIGGAEKGAAYVILRSALAPPHSASPAHTWLDQLIEAAQDDSTASDALASVLNVLFMGHPLDRKLLLAVQTVDEESNEAYAFTVRYLIEGTLRATQAPQPFIRLSPRHTTLLKTWRARCAATESNEIQKSKHSLSWFLEHQDTIARTFETKCQEILEKTRRGLRPGGLDHVDINIAALRSIGIRSIAFYPEGCTFPNVKVHILARKTTPHVIVYEASFENFHLREIPKDVFYVPNAAALHALLEYVIVDILHRILVGDEKLRAKKRWERTGKEDGKQLIGERNVTVRPHFRRLPEGWHASDGAKDDANKTFGWLPPGHTFVHCTKIVAARYEKGRIVYDLPTEPVATYGEDDLFVTNVAPTPQSLLTPTAQPTQPSFFTRIWSALTRPFRRHSAL